MCVLLTSTYGCQTWTLTTNTIKKLRSTQNAMERSMLNINRKDKMQIKIIKQKLKENMNIINYVRWQKWGWAGHISRMKNERWTYKTTFWTPINYKIKWGQQPKRWKDDFENCLQNKNFRRIAINWLEWGMAAGNLRSLRAAADIKSRVHI